MKKLILIILIVLMTGCNSQTISNIDDNSNDNVLNESEEIENMETINVIINDETYIANLENNETVEEFLKMLPLTLNMSELNGNEKYYYLDNNLPVNPTNSRNIEAGDIMLYGDDCLVIFYESFITSYSYTKIGHIENMPNLDSNAITVQFIK